MKKKTKSESFKTICLIVFELFIKKIEDVSWIVLRLMSIITIFQLKTTEKFLIYLRTI